LICRWFSFSAAELKSVRPLTERPRLGARFGVFGIWYCPREVPKIPVTRVFGSMMPLAAGARRVWPGASCASLWNAPVECSGDGAFQ